MMWYSKNFYIKLNFCKSFIIFYIIRILCIQDGLKAFEEGTNKLNFVKA